MSNSPLKFLVNQEKGQVSALFKSADNPIARLLLAHGAGANMFHSHMQNLADALSDQGIETVRYHFPYMEQGGGRTDKLSTCLDTIKAACEFARSEFAVLPTFLAGHSFGGRMSSHYAATAKTEVEHDEIRGLVYFSFPLHPAKKPGTSRAEHLGEISIPQLFLSGTRDDLAELALLEPIVNQLSGASLHTLETADHGFKILKRTRVAEESVYDEAARHVREFIEHLLAQQVQR